jgi:hypothetical protein
VAAALVLAEEVGKQLIQLLPHAFTQNALP